MKLVANTTTVAQSLGTDELTTNICITKAK